MFKIDKKTPNWSARNKIKQMISAPSQDSDQPEHLSNWTSLCCGSEETKST